MTQCLSTEGGQVQIEVAPASSKLGLTLTLLPTSVVPGASAEMLSPFPFRALPSFR